MQIFRRIEASLAAALVFCAIFSFLPFEGRCESIRGKVLRLHILANSDSDEDQALKLLVRDELLVASQEIFSGCESIDDAAEKAAESLELMELIAAECIAENGYCYGVTVELDKSFFLTRKYDDITLPAGIYNALKVYIGDAQGHNWWCVMYPMLCIPGASAQQEQLGAVLSEDELEMVSDDGYELRFYCVELYEELMEYLREKKSAQQ